MSRFQIVLEGCRTRPVGGYLAGLGFLAAVHRHFDPGALGHWQDGCFVLTTRMASDQVVDHLVESFEPIPVVSPWNGGSGFAANGKSPAAEKVLARVRESTDPRLERMRAGVDAADAVVRDARARGWESSKASELWDKNRKADLIALCRQRFPDEALPWVDAAAVRLVNEDGEAALGVNRLLGTGGNLGRLDLSITYNALALRLIEDPDASHRWLEALIEGREDVGYERGPVGQFDPGRAGGIWSSPNEKRDDQGFVNPWAFVLWMEASLLFASAVTRKQSAAASQAAIPFVVRGSEIGFASSAESEDVSAELWLPEWHTPATFGEIRQLMREGRAEWNNRPARDGLDFVRAVGSFGVSRGIAAFTRHLIVDRHGQSPLAIPAGRFEVTERPEVPLLRDLDPWLLPLRRSTRLPSTVASALRQLDTQIFRVASGGGPPTLRKLISALGRLHETVAKSETARELTTRPLMLPPGRWASRSSRADQWLEALGWEESAELRIAAALASGRDAGDDPAVLSLRALLTSVHVDKWQLSWSNRPPRVLWGSGIGDALAGAHHRRVLIGDQVTESSDDNLEKPAVLGPLSAFRHATPAPVGDLVAFVTGRLDDRLLADYLRGLLLVGSARITAQEQNEPTRRPIPTPLSLLLPFYAPAPLKVRLDPDSQQRTPLMLRPGASWIPLLRAGRVPEVLQDAARRLRISGITGVIDPAAASRAPVHGPRLAAGLLIPVRTSERVRALSAIATLPDRRDSGDDTDTAAAELVEAP